MFKWDSTKARNALIRVEKGFTFSLKTDEVVAAYDHPGYMTDRIRESLRRNKNGQLYVHTDNDREREEITDDGQSIHNFCQRWADEMKEDGIKT